MMNSHYLELYHLPLPLDHSLREQVLLTTCSVNQDFGDRAESTVATAKTSLILHRR
jgi:hypothetical protein